MKCILLALFLNIFCKIIYKSRKRTPQMNKNIDSSGNHRNVSHSAFDSAIPFIQFIYESEGIAGVAELYRSVVGKQNTNHHVNSILVSIRI